MKARLAKLRALYKQPKIRALLDQDLRKADHFMLRILCLHWFLAVTVVGVANGMYLTGFIGGGVIVTLGWLTHRLLPGSHYAHMMFGACIMLFSGLYIQQGLGRIEWHFHVFAALAFTSCYRDLRPLCAAVVTIAIHHVALNYCQQFGVTLGGNPLLVFDYGTGLDIVLLHAGFVVFEACVLAVIIIDSMLQFCVRTRDAEQNREVVDTLERVLTLRDTRISLDANHPQAEVVNQLLALTRSSLSTRVGFDHAGVAMVIVDERDAVLRANQSARSLVAAIAPDSKIGGGASSSTESMSAILRRGSVSDRLRSGLHILEVSGRQLEVTVTPVQDDDGATIGAIYELIDRTTQQQMEQQLARILTRAGEGSLSDRLELVDKGGFLGGLATNINTLLTVSETLVSDCAAVLESVSHGDLTSLVTAPYSGQFGQLTGSLNDTVVQLRDTVEGIKSGALSVEHEAIGIATSNSHLSERMRRKESRIRDAASGMHKITHSVRDNATDALSANTLAAQASEQAQHGGTVVERAVDAMRDIRVASQRVAEITSVIDEIAFQTNLLALNASVEAARAGEHGRGFAVVASEVQNLAARSATAAKEINVLITDSVAKVEEGAALVDESGKTLASIVESVDTATKVVEQISAAGQVQSREIEAVEQSIGELAAETQSDATVVKQAAEASQRMGDEAKQLAALVDVFDVGEDYEKR
ncbi:MAG: methyl-accepting chemotaxis protein [Pseudomonadota bacterium]